MSKIDELRKKYGVDQEVMNMIYDVEQTILNEINILAEAAEKETKRLELQALTMQARKAFLNEYKKARKFDRPLGITMLCFTPVLFLAQLLPDPNIVPEFIKALVGLGWIGSPYWIWLIIKPSKYKKHNEALKARILEEYDIEVNYE